ncbi:DUF6814 family protein [Aquirufa sp. KTFRIE-69F]|jgi:hypothetical protein|uniref:DUF6814 family protein n=1 Tax=Aquirufa originis TaxID=3096514 RepID=A0ABW6D5G3_9BACT|nr:hypothetical protein [Aquirufa antheringensis]MCE4216206.1 hypothetical protein [Pseudarcicella sp. GAP-15]MCL9967735.1 hypothetical protein [Aquirufa antheringensis]USQ04206.1 hypothetical protein G9X63_08820 [Aquirufa antheringensis]
MNLIKRILGIVWIGLGIGAGIYLIYFQAVPLWAKGGNDLVPAIIYTFVLAPLISIGMSLFGFYALQGEFDTI